MRSKNTYLLLFLFFTGIHASYGQTRAFDWVNEVAGPQSEAGYGIATDKEGNIYVTGNVQGTVKISTGPGSPQATKEALGNSDIFLAKYHPMGYLMWVHTIGGTDKDEGRGIALDDAGNVYITGNFSGKADFDPGTGVYELESSGAEDAFVAKYTGAGQLLWAKKIGSPKADFGQALTVNHKNEVIVTGRYSEPVQFTPSIELPHTGSSDIFVAKYSTEGNELWAIGFGGANGDQGEAVAVDKSAHIFVTGRFNTSADFDPGAGNTVLSAYNNSTDIFLAKYSDVGTLMWVRSFGSRSTDYAQALTTDSDGNVYFAGNFNDTLNIVTASGIKKILNKGRGFSDIVIAKHDPEGNHIWSYSLGGNRYDNVFGMSINSSSELYITGQFGSDSTNFGTDPLHPVFHKPIRGTYDMFIAKYDSSGKYIWSKAAGGTSSDYAAAIATGKDNDVYITGNYILDIGFETLGDSIRLTSAGSNDMIIAKLQEYCESFIKVDQASCGSYTFKDKEYFASGVYVDTFTNQIGCDSIVTLHLTVNKVLSDTLSLSACDSVTINEVTYYTTGTYQQDYQSVNGCDSNYVYDLIIYDTDTATELTVTACSSYRINDTLSYSQTGVHVIRLLNQGGCDSTVILDLEIQDPEPGSASVIKEGQALRAAGTKPGATYQWFSCDRNALVTGASGATFDPEETGSYALILNTGACADTSECIRVEIETSRIAPEESKGRVTIYPNPAGDMLYISPETVWPVARIRLLTITGQVVLSREIKDFKHPLSLDLSSCAPGIYFVETANGADNPVRMKVIKRH